jgi:hypothetical protein
LKVQTEVQAWGENARACGTAVGGKLTPVKLAPILPKAILGKMTLAAGGENPSAA